MIKKIFLFNFFVFTAILFLNCSFAQNNSANKSLRIYMGGISTINEEYSGFSRGSEFNMSFLVPRQTITSTLNVCGLSDPVVNYKAIEKTYLIAEGDEIAVFLNDGSYFIGTLLNRDGWEFGYGPIILNVEKYKDVNRYESPYVVINEELIKTIELKNLNNIENMLSDKSDSMNIIINGEVTSLPVVIAYATRGVFNWTPQYTINLDNGDFKAFAEVASNFDIGETNLTLILGNPYIEEIYTASPIVEAAMMEQTRGGVGAAFEDVSQIGEQWQYPYKGTVVLNKGVVSKVRLFDAKYNLKQFYFWDGGKTMLKYSFKNISKNPLANGTISIYRDNSWIGQDVLNWVSEGEETEFTAEIAYDVDINEKTSREETSSFADRTITTTTKDINIHNYKNKQIEIKIERTIPYNANFLEATVKPTIEGKKLKWHVIAEANENYVISYTYETVKLIK
jgi:hypothetical protein